MEDVEFVEVENYPDPKLIAENPFIISKENCDVEMTFKNNQNSNDNSKVVKVSEIYLFLQNEEIKDLEPPDQKKVGGKYPIESFLVEKDGTETYYSSFNAMLEIGRAHV